MPSSTAAFVVWTASQLESLPLFVVGFVLLFVFSGIGNGSTYKMIPAIFRSQALTSVSEGGDPVAADRRALRMSGALIGIAGAVVQTAVGLCIFLAYGTTASVARRVGAGDVRGEAFEAVLRGEGPQPRSAALAGRPVVGICNSWSELVNCNLHFRSLAESAKRGVLLAGGLPPNALTKGFPSLTERVESGIAPLLPSPAAYGRRSRRAASATGWSPSAASRPPRSTATCRPRARRCSPAWPATRPRTWRCGVAVRAGGS